MTTTEPQVSVTHFANAPRVSVYDAFTEPDQFAAWWGPIGNALPREEVDADVRAGGYIRWHEVFPERPGTWTNGRIDFTEVVAGEVLDGVMRITGELPGGFKPFETRMRVEFFDEADGRTRIEVRQWLPDEYVSPTKNGWAEAFSKLDTQLAR